MWAKNDYDFCQSHRYAHKFGSTSPKIIFKLRQSFSTSHATTPAKKMRKLAEIVYNALKLCVQKISAIHCERNMGATCDSINCRFSQSLSEKYEIASTHTHVNIMKTSRIS